MLIYSLMTDLRDSDLLQKIFIIILFSFGQKRVEALKTYKMINWDT